MAPQNHFPYPKFVYFSLSDLNKISYFAHMAYVCLVAQACPTPCDPMDCYLPSSSPWGFSMQEYWSGLLCPPPGDLANPVTEPRSLASQADSLLSEPSGKS